MSAKTLLEDCELKSSIENFPKVKNILRIKSIVKFYRAIIRNALKNLDLQPAMHKSTMIRQSRFVLNMKKQPKLAKCGNGVLSLTDEEKLRIENLLKEPDAKIEDPPDDSSGLTDLNTSFSSVCSDNLYVLSDEAKEILEEIDKKLKEYSKLKLPDPVPKFKSTESDISSESKEAESSNSSEQEKPTKKPKKNSKRKFIPLKDEGYRLKEVDKLIGIINSVSNEEISPLSEEDIKTLIEKVKLSLDLLPPETTERTETTESKTETEISMPMPSPEKVSDLVNAAKSQMPNFKYRYANA